MPVMIWVVILFGPHAETIHRFDPPVNTKMDCMEEMRQLLDEKIVIVDEDYHLECVEVEQP
jgi:hypothetical protein